MKLVLLYTSSHFKDDFVNMFCNAVLLCISLAFFMSRGVYIFLCLSVHCMSTELYFMSHS